MKLTEGEASGLSGPEVLRLINDTVAQERDECAQIADTIAARETDRCAEVAQRIAAQIRARA